MHNSTVSSSTVLMRVHKGLLAAVAAVLMAACASTPPAPVAALTTAREAITRAEQADARQYAPQALDEAQQQLQAAEIAVQSQDMQLAERAALRSTASGELALARTELAKALEVNRELTLGIEALIQEMQRAGARQ